MDGVKRGKDKKKISPLLSPILEHVFLVYVRVCLYSSTSSFTLSISQLIIFNCSLVDRACENSLKNKCLFIPFFSRVHFNIQTTIRDQSIHCYILLSKQNMTMTFYILLRTVLILFSVVQHL